MTYASQQLAEALQQLVRDAAVPHDYSNHPLPASIETQVDKFPPAVADFLEKTSNYAARTKSVSVGVY